MHDGLSALLHVRHAQLLVCHLQGDIVGCLADFTQSPAIVRFTVNGQDKGMAFSLPEHMKGRSNALFPAVCLKAATASVNFGDQPLKHLPHGYAALSKAPAEALTTGTALRLCTKKPWLKEQAFLAGRLLTANSTCMWGDGLCPEHPTLSKLGLSSVAS